MNINLHFTEKDWERVERDWKAWWAGELDRPMVIIPTMDIFFSASRDEYTKDFLLEKPVDEVLDYHQTHLESAHYYGDAWPKWIPYLGPGIVSAFLGGKAEPMREQRTVWFEADEPVPVEDLHFVYDATNIWWQRALNLTRAAIERWGDQVSVAHTDLGGILDILASFRTANQLLYDLYDIPDEVTRLTGEIRALWLRYYDELHDIIKKAGRGTTNWGPILSPGRTYMHQCDFCYMISPRMFEQFVLPDLAACFEQLDHAFYHLDGKGQIPHLDMLLSLESLAGIQWIPGAGQPGPSKWLPLLKRIRDGGKLCQVFVNEGEARTIVRELGGRGFALFITPRGYSIEEYTLSRTRTQPISDTETEDFLKVIAAEDISLH
jgi:5-methyltetrahydrofolate--homocysteine methyltransferase